MTTRKGQNIELRNGIYYYGDEPFLKIDSFENEKNILQARISGLEWRNKALTISVMVLLISSLGHLAFSVFHQLEIDNTGRQIEFLSGIRLSGKD